MLVLDEVQCGVARTGTMFFYEQAGIEPDIMAIAKGIGGGFPLGACLATEKAARGMTFGTHGSTYGGNPLAMAAGMAVLDAVANEAFLAEVRDKGERIRARLEQFIGNYPELFEGVRGKGLMLGVKMKAEPRPFMQHLRDNHQSADRRRRRPDAADPAAAGDRRRRDRRVLRQALGRRGRLQSGGGVTMAIRAFPRPCRTPAATRRRDAGRRDRPQGGARRLAQGQADADSRSPAMCWR